MSLRNAEKQISQPGSVRHFKTRDIGLKITIQCRGFSDRRDTEIKAPEVLGDRSLFDFVFLVVLDNGECPVDLPLKHISHV